MEYLLTIPDDRGVTPASLGIAHVLVWFGYEIGDGDVHRDRRLLGHKKSAAAPALAEAVASPGAHESVARERGRLADLSELIEGVLTRR
jgi:hypothetical protein